MTEYLLSPLKKDLAAAICGWQYPPPYDVYNLSREDLAVLLNPVYRYHQVLDQAGNLVGYCCFGADARVPGGRYFIEEPTFLDVGVGMHPELIGQGLGTGFVEAILDHAQKLYQPENFRVSVANFNQRSLKTFRKLGFEETYHFNRVLDGMPFTQLERRSNE